MRNISILLDYMFISYNQAIKLDPRDAKAWHNKGHLLNN